MRGEGAQYDQTRARESSETTEERVVQGDGERWASFYNGRGVRSLFFFYLLLEGWLVTMWWWCDVI